jgi:uncharacterized protein (TIGR02145 family)
MVSMKKHILIFFLFTNYNLFAQTNMNIYYTFGTVLSIPITDIDSAYYSYDSSTCPLTLIDTDGNLYNTVLIGNQCWMKENLKTTHYSNGTNITTGLSNSQWIASSSGACSDYSDDTAIAYIYGKLYNWYAIVDPAGLCPVGWHVPDTREWNKLTKLLDTNADTLCLSCAQSLIAGGLMKEVGNSHWTNNLGVTNFSGFTALPGGSRASTIGNYFDLLFQCYFWTSTSYSLQNAYFYNLRASDTKLYKTNFDKIQGMSVRCIKD